MAKTTNEIINLIFKCLQEHREGLAFVEIWDKIADQIFVEGAAKDQIVGKLYADLVLDHRFIITKERVWNLKENMKFKDLQKETNYADRFTTVNDLRDFDTITADIGESANITSNSSTTRIWDDVQARNKLNAAEPDEDAVEKSDIINESDLS